MPDQDPTLPLSESNAAEKDENTLSHLPDAHQEVVRQLQAKVERATSLMSRLQAENRRLRQRIEELERRPAIPDDKTALALDEDPEALRTRISSFIDAIDDYLDTDPTQADDADPPASGDGTS